MRYAELDALRGLAALAVVLFHYTFLYNERIGHSEELSFIASYGGLGVYLFFIISGFVIFLTLKRCKSHTDFIVSRFSRIFPAYWIAIILTAIVVNIYDLKGLHRSIDEILVNLTMLQGYIGIQHVDEVYWTLTYELLFYTFMYLIYRLKLIHKIDHILFLWLSLQLSSILIEYYYGWFPWKITYFMILGYIHLFAAGIFFLKIHEGEHSMYHYLLLVYCLLIQWIKGPTEESIAVTIFGIIFIVFIGGWLKFIAIRPLIFLGSISYPLYLIHQNIGYVLINKLQTENVSTIISLLLTISIMIITATLINLYVEKPSMRYLKARYYKIKNK